MYRIVAVNEEERRVIYHPLSSSFYIHSAKIDHKINVYTVLTMELYPTPDLKLEEFKTTFEVYEDATDNLIFKGRLINRERNMDSAGFITNICEVECMLSLLGDICLREYKKEKIKASTIYKYIFDKYNSTAKYKINLGTVSKDSTLDEIDVGYKTCYEALTTVLEEAEAELELIYNDASLTVNIKDKLGSDKGAQVRLGINMIDLLAQASITELCTRFIPISKSGDKTVTISSVNGGKDYLVNTALENQIGCIIEKVEENNDIEKASKLLTWGKKKLDEYSKVDLTLNVNYVDIEFMNTKKFSVSLGDTLNVYNPLLNIYNNSRVSGITIDLLEPHNPQVELSSRKKGLTDRVIELKSKNTNKAVITNTTYTILDNITPQAPLTDSVNINKASLIKNAHIYLVLDRYTIYSEEGVIYDTYPKDVKVYVNDVLVSTLAGNAEEEAIINIDGKFKDGTNKIKFTCTQRGRINAKVEISSNA